MLKMGLMSRKRMLAISAFTLILSLLFLAGCQKTPFSEKSHYRFVDLAGPENIVASQFLGKNIAPLTDVAYPMNSTLLLDAGAGENSLGLKRKLNLGTVEFNILFSPPRSEYSFNMTLPDEGVFDFGIGIVRDQNSESVRIQRYGKEEGVEFIVLLEVAGRKKTIFQKHLKIPPLRETRTVNFSQNKIILPVRNKEARITLITGGEEGTFAFWANPVLYDRTRKRTNVILVSIDTLRADHLRVYGYGRDTSPAMDALARDSAVFMNTYASSPWTLPSHVSMLTSLNGINHHVYYEDERMDSARLTLADLLKQSFSSCAAFTGGGFLSSFYGFSKGFDSYSMDQGDIVNPRLAEIAAQRALEWLDANSDKVFFLFLHTYQPHSPYNSPEPYNSIFLGENPKWIKFDVLEDLGGKYNFFKKLSEDERRNVIALYDGEIRYTDEYLIKPLIEKLKSLNIYNQTLLIVTSDHGEEFLDHGSWGHTHNLYNESLKVPLIIKFPYSKYAGKKVNTAVRLIDLMPTILEEQSIEFHEDLFDGRSLMPILKGDEKADRAFTADIAENVLGYRTPFKIAMNGGKDKVILNNGFRQEDLAYFRAPPPPVQTVELYDLEKDPAENNNLAGAPEKLPSVRRLVQALNEMAKAIKPREGAKAKINKELEDQLRALGYIR